MLLCWGQSLAVLGPQFSCKEAKEFCCAEANFGYAGTRVLLCCGESFPVLGPEFGSAEAKVCLCGGQRFTVLDAGARVLLP